jgi:hypothetical protein
MHPAPTQVRDGPASPPPPLGQDDLALPVAHESTSLESRSGRSQDLSTKKRESENLSTKHTKHTKNLQENPRSFVGRLKPGKFKGNMILL